MYNFLSKNRKTVGCSFLIIILFIAFSLFCFASDIFTKENVYFYTSSTIVQGFIALVALLGAVVVFKVQLEDQAMQKLADGIEVSVAFYRGDAAKTYTPTQMMNACKEILGHEKENYGSSKDLIKKVSDKMEETLASRNETRNKMVDFAVICFLNVAIALVGLLFTPVFIIYWCIGGVLLSANVFLSIYSLNKALQVVRSTMGYGFSITM